jgi:copper chaperone CopZ
MKKLVLSFAAATLLAAAAPFGAVAEKPPVTQSAATGETVTASVNGLVCDFCAASIKKVFRKEAAISDVKVDLDAGKVVLTFKPGQSLADDRIKTLIKQSGYALTGIERAAG